MSSSKLQSTRRVAGVVGLHPRLFPFILADVFQSPSTALGVLASVAAVSIIISNTRRQRFLEAIPISMRDLASGLLTALPTVVWKGLPLVYDLFSHHFTSHTEVFSPDETFHAVLLWLGKRPKFASIFSAPRTKAWANSSRQLEVEPIDGTFTWQGRTFWAHNTTPKGKQEKGEVSGLSVCCYGRSDTPISQLLAHVLDTADPAKQFSQIHTWNKSGWVVNEAKPARGLDTIELDGTLKETTVTDIRNFLEPATKARYLANGWPYRKGLLFFGPSGTGQKLTHSRSCDGNRPEALPAQRFQWRGQC